MKKILTVFCLSIGMIVIFISVNVLANSTTKGTNLVDKYYEYGSLNNEYSNPSEKTQVAVITGEPYVIDNYNNTIKGCLLMDQAETKEEAVEYLVTQEVLEREAHAQNIVVDDKAVDSFIEEQKRIYASEEGKECKDDLNAFINGLGLTENEYWEKYYEVYREQLEIGELKEQLYDEFLYEKVVERLKELGMELTEEEIQNIYENEKAIYNDDIYKEFQDYYQSYKKDLLVKYDVKFTVNVN